MGGRDGLSSNGRGTKHDLFSLNSKPRDKFCGPTEFQDVTMAIQAPEEPPADTIEVTLDAVPATTEEGTAAEEAPATEGPSGVEGGGGSKADVLVVGHDADAPKLPARPGPEGGGPPGVTATNTETEALPVSEAAATSPPVAAAVAAASAAAVVKQHRPAAAAASHASARPTALVRAAHSA